MNQNKNFVPENKEAAELGYLKAQTDKLIVEVEQLKRTSRKWVVALKYFGIGLALAPFLIGYSFLVRPFFDRQNLIDSIGLKKVELAEINHKIDKRNYEHTIDSLRLLLFETMEENDKQQIEKSKIQNEIATEKKKGYKDIESVIGKLESENRQNPNELKKLNEISSNIQTHKNFIDQKISQNPLTESSANKAIDKKGWIYIGHYVNNTFGTTRKLNVDKIPEKGKEYEITSSCYLRENRPKAPFYKIPSQIQLLPGKTRIEVLEVEPDVGFNKVWIKVKVVG